jgi:hypothetical protein
LNAVNTWIATHGSEIATFGKEFGTYLVEGAHAVKTAIGFLIEHKSELLAIGAAWAASKLVGGIGGGIGGLVSGGIGMVSGEGAAVNFAGKLLGVVDQRAQSVALGSLRGNVGMLAANASGGGGLGGLVRSELLVTSLRGLPDAAQVAQRGLLGFGAATALGLGKFETGALTVSGALSALPGPIGLVAKSFTLLDPVLHGLIKLGEQYAESVQKLNDDDYYDGKTPEYWQKGVYERRRDERQKDYERMRDQDIGTDDEIKARLGGGYNLNNMLVSLSVRALFVEKSVKSVKSSSTSTTTAIPARCRCGIVSTRTRCRGRCRTTTSASGGSWRPTTSVWVTILLPSIVDRSSRIILNRAAGSS